MNVTELNVTKRLGAASFALALSVATGALAAPPSPTLPTVGTLTISAPFGSSPVLAWSWGASNSGTTNVGGGGGAGKANIQDLSLTRYADGQSPLFFNAVAKGQHLASVVLVAGSTTITLMDVLVASYSTGDSSPEGKPTTRTENITFNFAKITYTVNGVATCFNSSTQSSC
ncbi:MAG: type VI secretion system tube protein Hcp [Vicinamibacterales bacterium]